MIFLISRFSAGVSFRLAFTGAASFCGFAFLNNLSHLLLHLVLSLDGSIEIVCLIWPLLRPDEHGLDDLPRDHFKGLPMPFIHGEKEKGKGLCSADGDLT